MWLSLIPVHDRSHVILQLQKPLIRTPSKQLQFNAQIFRKEYRIVHTEAVQRKSSTGNAVQRRRICQSRWRHELIAEIRCRKALAQMVFPKAPSTPKIIFCSCIGNCGIFRIPVNVHMNFPSPNQPPLFCW